MVEAVLRESLNVSVSTFGLRPHPDAASAHLIPCGGVLSTFYAGSDTFGQVVAVNHLVFCLVRDFLEWSSGSLDLY